jgi:hypothetical protein
MNRKIIFKWIIGVFLMIAVCYIGHFMGFPENKMINPGPLWESFIEHPFGITLLIIGVPGLYIYWSEKNKANGKRQIKRK